VSDEPSSVRGRPREPVEEHEPDIRLPDQPPELNPAAARTLLRILLRAHRSSTSAGPHFM
jgi:hypothetical protein